VEPLEVLANRRVRQAQLSRVLRDVIVLCIVGLEGKENSGLVAKSNGGNEFLKAKTLDGKSCQFSLGGEGNLDVKVRLVETGDRCLGVPGPGLLVLLLWP